MLVRNRMTPNPITITPDLSIAEAMEWMKREDVRRFPVVDKDRKLVGIVTHTDLLYASPSSATSLSMWEISYLLAQVTVKEVMTKDVITVTEDTVLEDAARLMADNKVGSLPVMRNGVISGIITESDIFRVFLEMMGAREKGIRVSLLAPYVKGSMAKITSEITSAGGLILSFDTLLGENSSNWGCTIKVTDITQEALLAAIEDHVVEIVDIRET
ncbi:MAG TPA: CBS domain-containing protein [Candidatus Sulfomarinibacteraceae bacterium]|nr:CBS domain-containing protein [Candidatus Sulfomarinibacteraceae bacterium]